MYREFIYDPTVNEYEKILSELVKSGILSLSSERVEVAELALLQQLTSYCKVRAGLLSWFSVYSLDFCLRTEQLLFKRLDENLIWVSSKSKLQALDKKKVSGLVFEFSKK